MLDNFRTASPTDVSRAAEDESPEPMGTDDEITMSLPTIFPNLSSTLRAVPSM